MGIDKRPYGLHPLCERIDGLAHLVGHKSARRKIGAKVGDLLMYQPLHPEQIEGSELSAIGISRLWKSNKKFSCHISLFARIPIFIKGLSS